MDTTIATLQLVAGHPGASATEIWTNSSTNIDPQEATDVNMTSYWPEFGELQYFELTYIILLICLGTIGNLVVIFSIVLERKVYSSGNVFIINLAIADFLICTITLPSVAANIVATDNALSEPMCHVVGYIVTTTCACSLCNLALIAFNRYWAVVRHASYRKHFTKKVGIASSVGSWIWSILLVSPTALGWGELTYDAKSQVCAWLDTASLSYSIFLIGFTVVLPMTVIAFSYIKIYCLVRSSSKWRRGLRAQTRCNNNNSRKHLSRREKNLIQTMLATIIAFCICWTPYAVHVFIDPGNTEKHAKKFLVWLALSNSSINFIIYGMLNPAFQKGYKKLFWFMINCKREEGSVGRSRSVWSSGNTVGPQNGMQVSAHSLGGSRSIELYEVGSKQELQAKEHTGYYARLKRFFTKKSTP